MRISRRLALGAALLALVSACTTGGGSQPTEGGATGRPPAAQEIAVGSAGFYEAQLMGEIYALALEDAGYDVTRQLGIGPRDQVHAAIVDGTVDLVPEYTGSLLSFLNLEYPTDAATAATGDSDATFDALQERLAEIDLVALDYAPAQDQNAFVVRPDTAEQFGLQTMSDLADVAEELVWGLPPECEENPVCGAGLQEVYGIDISTLEVRELAACDTPIAIALSEGEVDVGQLCSTQPDIERFGFVVLEDDRGLQPAENIVPVVRADYLEAAGEGFAEILNAVSAEMTTDELLELGVRVAVEQEDIADVASDWLAEHGLAE